jgi:hypothetical protein
MELLQGRRRLHDGAAANAHRTKKTPQGSCCLEGLHDGAAASGGTPRWSCCLEGIQCLDGSRWLGEPTGGAEPEEDSMPRWIARWPGRTNGRS